MKRHWIGGVVVAACSLAFGSAVAEEGAAKFRAPADILKALEASPRRYILGPLSELKDPKPASPSEFWAEVRPPVGRAQVAVAPDGSRSLSEFEVDPNAWALLQQGEPAFQEGRFADALEAWKPEAAAYPDDPLVQIFLGDGWLFSGRYDLALEAYTRATQQNPSDYQAHLFRARALQKLGLREEALDALARALVCRPRHEGSLKIARGMASDLGVEVVDEVFVPRAVVRKDDEGTHIYADSVPWIAWANCKAAWMGEPEFRAAAGVKAGQWSTHEELECLVSLVSVSDGDGTDDASAKDPALDRIVKIAESGQAYAMVMYEMGSRLWADMLLLQSPEQQDQLKRYVREFILPPKPSKP